jgi:hypothetical protein
MHLLCSALMLRAAIGLLTVLFAVGSTHAAENWLAVSHRLAPSGGAFDFTPHGTQPGLFNQLIFSDNCAGCHRGDTPAQTTFRPYSSWAGSMMANATRDPLFWAALDIANHDAPGSGDYCLRCHTPRGWIEGRVIKAGFGAPDNDTTKGAAGCLLAGAYDSADDLDSDFGGETCHFCHRLMPQGPGGEAGYTENANAWVDDDACTNTGESEPCRRGPYAYASGATPPHPWVQSDYHTQGAICGLCHNVTSPDTSNGPLKTLKLNNGTDTTRPFPIERTFSEWSNSLFADLIFRDGFGDAAAGLPALAKEQSCQACHMPQSEDPGATACSLPGYPNRTGNLPVHAFAGGNTWVPGIIKGQYAPGIVLNGGSDRAASYDQSIDWARQILVSAAGVTTTVQSYTPPGAGAGSMAVAVKVTNLSGHKLPTGYAEGRRMWLNLQVHDANGGLVYESGAYDTASGVLNADAQARIYEVQHGIFNHLGSNQCDVENSAGNAMFHFVLNDCIAKDNRIPPLGFKPATTADPNGYELRPVGATYPETSPGSGILVNYDTANYALTVPVGTVGPLTATARLYYQTSSKDYIEFLRDEAIANSTQAENDMCMGSANRPFTVGPQGRTRGEYAYQLWNNAPADTQPGYGKSPPELMQTASATTSR